MKTADRGAELRGTRPTDLDVAKVEIKVMKGASFHGDHCPVLVLPPYPVFPFLAPGGATRREDLHPVSTPMPPNTQCTQIAIKPGRCHPKRGDRIILFWSEVEGTARPWAELCEGPRETEDDPRDFRLRPVPESFPRDIAMRVPGRTDRAPDGRPRGR